MAFTGLFIKLRDGRIPFNLGWWAFTFPLGSPPTSFHCANLGTFGLASGFLGQQFDNNFFKVVACIDTVVVVLFWFWVSGKCIQRTIDGRLFFKQGFHESHSNEHLHRTQRDWKRSRSVADQRGSAEQGENGQTHQ
jgi:hypothetical protein